MRNCINVSQKNNLVIIKIHPEAKIEDIIPQIRKKASQLQKIYKEEKTPIMITGKVLKNKEMDEIEEIIKEKLDVDVDFDMPKELGLHNIKKTFIQEVSISETKFHRGSLRSGQRLEYEGTLIVLGDVNDGAEVIAGDNVVVVGNLRGLAHAGAKGNKQAIVAAHRIDTHQLRIANIIKELVKDDDAYNVAYTYAYVHENGREIVLE